MISQLLNQFLSATIRNFCKEANSNNRKLIKIKKPPSCIQINFFVIERIKNRSKTV